MTFAQQVVWITGASSGIGEATARAFARAGARLVLSSRRIDELERVRLSCERPEDHAVVSLDLTRSEMFPHLVTDVLARFGHIDVLINNGGVSQRALVAQASLDSERALMEIDYFGPVALTKAVLPSMRARRSGRIVVISSVMGYIGTPGRSTYAAAKHALHGYFDSLQAEIWQEGIGVTLVCPGYVKTAVARNAFGPDGRKQGRANEADPKGITPEKCASAILRGVARRQAEVYVGGWEVSGIYLKRFAPWLLTRILRRIKFSVGSV